MNLHLPTLNACLNGLSACFLLAGFIFIKNNRISAHRWAMTAAFCTSTLFLISYLYYHYHSGSTKFMGTGFIRTVYFSILISHTILATAIVPLILTSLSLAWRGNYERHRKWARVTWPLWMYVSVTGVVIYWMLYQ